MNARRFFNLLTIMGLKGTATGTGRIGGKHINLSNKPKEILEHCPDCIAHTGDGRRCITCEDQRQKEYRQRAHREGKPWVDGDWAGDRHPTRQDRFGEQARGGVGNQ